MRHASGFRGAINRLMLELSYGTDMGVSIVFVNYSILVAMMRHALPNLLQSILITAYILPLAART